MSCHRHRLAHRCTSIDFRPLSLPCVAIFSTRRGVARGARLDATARLALHLCMRRSNLDRSRANRCSAMHSVYRLASDAALQFKRINAVCSVSHALCICVPAARLP